MDELQADPATTAVMEAIRARRSIRKYKPDPVDEGKLRLVIEAAILAPNAFNAQPWDFVVVTAPETRAKVAAVVMGGHRRLFGEARKDAVAGAELEERLMRFSGLAQAPAFIVPCLHRKRLPLKEGFDSHAAFWDVLSVGAAVENLIIAATALGLGTCWMGSLALREDALKELLDIPAAAQIAGVLALGQPDESPKPRPRDPFEQVVHYDRW